MKELSWLGCALVLALQVGCGSSGGSSADTVSNDAVDNETAGTQDATGSETSTGGSCGSGAAWALTQVGTGTKAGGYKGPMAVGDGCTFYAEWSNGIEPNRLEKIVGDSVTKLSTEEDYGGSIVALGVNPSGDLMAILDSEADGVRKLVKLGADGKVAATVVADLDAAGLKNPDSHLAFDADGTIYVGNFMGGEPWFFQIKTDGTVTKLADGPDPSGLGKAVVGSAGDIYVLGTNLLKFENGALVPFLADFDAAMKTGWDAFVAANQAYAGGFQQGKIQGGLAAGPGDTVVAFFTVVYQPTGGDWTSVNLLGSIAKDGTITLHYVDKASGDFWGVDGKLYSHGAHDFFEIKLQ